MGVSTRLLSMLGIRPGEDIHRVYSFLDRQVVNGHPVRMVRWVSLGYHFFWPVQLKVPLLHVVNQTVMLLQIVWAAVSAPGLIIVREFEYRLFALTAFLVWPWRSRLLLNINFSIPLPGDSPKSSVTAFRWLVHTGFRFLLFEGDAVRSEVEAAYPGIQLACAPFVVPDRGAERPVAAACAQAKFVVGFVGEFRRDKGGYEALVAAMKPLLAVPALCIRMGIRNPEHMRFFPHDIAAGVEFTNTFLPDDYERFISTCDAIVILAQRSGYYRRHSAIILDCVSLRTLVVCPAFPLFASEIGNPVQVGTTFDAFDNLPAAVLDAQRRAVELRANHSDYFAGRRLTAVTTALESAVSSTSSRNR